MKRNIKILISSLCSILLLLSPITCFDSAYAEDNSGQALEIGPPLITLSADPGETVSTKVSVRNVSGGDLEVQGEINDFVAYGEDGTPKIILDTEVEKDNPYSIKNWISPLPQYILIPKQIENVSIIISVPANAAPGGYYGAIRFTPTPPELKGTGVSLAASISSLILLKVNGEAKESLNVEEFYATKNKGQAMTLFEVAPVDFVVRILNDGNVHETPVGQIIVTDMFNNKIASVNVNLSTNNVLPDSIRKFEQSLDSSVIGDKLLFGKYKAELKIKYGATSQELTQSIEFWVIPYTMIAVVAVGLVAGFMILRFAIKRYNQHIINKATQSRRKHKR